MKKFTRFLFLLFLLMGVIAESGHVVQALRFARGGQQDTYYDILACTDGMIFSVGLNVPNAPSTPEALFARVETDGEDILGGASFALDGPSNVTIYDAASNAPIVLTHTGTLTASWLSGTGNPTVVAGMRIRVVVPEIRNAGQTIGVADSFYSIVQPCSIQSLPPDRENRVFYPPGGDVQNPGNNVPDKTILPFSVVTSTIPVNIGVGKTIADVNLGMYIKNVVSGQISVTLISPAGTRVKMFENVASEYFGRREINLDNGLVRDLMPDFVLDDASTFNFGDPSVAHYVDASAIKPTEALGQLNGEDPNGDWLLEIHNTGSVNQLQCWPYSGTPNLTIPDDDLNGVTVRPNVSMRPGRYVSDVNVILDITHGSTGELTAYLRNPTNTSSSTLVYLVGDEGDNFTNTRLDDAATQSIYDGTPPFTGSYRPVSPLSVFNGQSGNGEWTLLLRDEFAGEEGTLNSWSVEVCEGLAGTLDSWALDIEVTPDKFNTYLPGVFLNQTSTAGWQTLTLPTAPTAGGSARDLSGYTRKSDGSLHLVYAGADAMVHELWSSDGVVWQHVAVGQLANAPAIAGEPMGLGGWDGSGGHIVYTGTDGQIHMLTFAPGTGWAHIPIGQQASAPLAQGSPWGFVWEGVDAPPHVVYRGVDSRIHELWYNPNVDQYRHSAIGTGGSIPVADGEPIGMAWPGGGIQYILFRAVDGQIHELRFTVATSSWQHNPLGASLGATGSADSLFGYLWTGTDSRHVMYRGQDGMIHELWASNGAEWRYATPSQGAHAPAATGSPFAYAWESKERQSVIYLGANGAIHELDGTKAGVWTYQTLAAASSLTPGGRPVGFGVAGGARQFIFFADTSGVIHGFWKE